MEVFRRPAGLGYREVVHTVSIPPDISMQKNKQSRGDEQEGLAMLGKNTRFESRRGCVVKEGDVGDLMGKHGAGWMEVQTWGRG